jgi:competence protein ComFC
MKILLFVKQIKNFLMDLLFPIKCLGCGEKEQILCNNCIEKIHLAEREMGNNIFAVFDYRDKVIKKAIWELKYHHKHYLGEKLGLLLYEFLAEDISDLKIEVSGRSIYVIPVPISKDKTRLRGYNQSLSIARGFCSLSPIGSFEIKNNIVFKKIKTIPQAQIKSRGERLKNIHGVFEIINKDLVKGRTIILIDDVTTTGGTMSEIMKILINAGAKKVVGFAVAH